MSQFSRRGFLRRSSVSAAAIGLLSAVPSLANASDEPQSSQAVPTSPITGVTAAPSAGPLTPALTAPFMIYVNDPSVGTGSIFVGEKEYRFTDPQVVRALQQALAS